MLCNLCPRKCNAQRTETENLNGFCKMPLLPRVAKACLHLWEEPIISGKNGSGTIFFSGCSLACVYCQNYDVSHNALGKTVSYERLAEIFKELEEKGAHNINLVTPSHYVLSIKKALEIYKPKIPVVYNSSGYDSVDTLKLLDGLVDIYLLDFKYLDDERAKAYSCAPNYYQIAKNALKEAIRQQPNSIIKDGIMQKGVIVRHLLLPQGTKEAMGVFDLIRENAPNVYFSIMSQYIPFGKALEMPVINRTITKREYEKIIDYISRFDFDKIFVQERISANKKYIPDFNFEGV